jgi:hypothetical protein
MRSSSRKQKRKRRDSNQHSWKARLLFGLNLAGFVAWLTGLAYHIYDLTANYSYSYSDLNWTDFTILTAGYALLLTWHYRIVFVKAYRAIEGLYLHLFAFFGLMGFWWFESLVPQVESAHIEGFLLPITLIWLGILLAHGWQIKRSPQSDRQKRHDSQADQPDITRLTDSTPEQNSAFQPSDAQKTRTGNAGATG